MVSIKEKVLDEIIKKKNYSVWEDSQGVEHTFNSLFEKIDKHENNNITTVTAPIFYLFDNDINDNIGSNSQIRKTYVDLLELNSLFSLVSDKIHSISLDGHATIIYFLENDGDSYLYYSNSGLGIHNNIRNIDKNTVAPKIYKLLDKSNVSTFYNIPVYINDIIENIKKINNKNDDKLIEETYTKLEGILKKYKGLPVIERHFFDDIIHYILKDENKYNNGPFMDLIYTLFNLLMKNELILECSFNILVDKDFTNREFSDVIKEITISENLFTNSHIETLNNNSIYYKKILKIKQTELPKLKPFNKFINDINSRLALIKEPTVDYKLKTFKLEHNYVSGIFNNEQKAGSCTFYSYYNLAVNMSLLNIFKDTSLDETQKIDKFIENFLTCHYKLIYLLCKSNDIKFMDKNINNFNNNTYIYKIIRDNNLVNDLLEFYPSDTFLLNTNTSFVDKILNLESDFPLEPIPSQISIKHINIFKELFMYLDEILYNIRNSNIIDIEKDIVDKLNRIFVPIINFTMISQKINIINFIRKRREDTERYFCTLKEIYILNLICLLESYKNPVIKNIFSNIICLFNYYEDSDEQNVKPKECDPRRLENYDDYDYGFKVDSNYDFLKIRLTTNEMLAMSLIIRKGTIITIKDKYKLTLDYCNFIGKKEYSEEKILVNNKSYNIIPGSFSDVLEEYSICIQILNNEKIHPIIKTNYNIIKNNIIKTVSKQVNYFINNVATDRSPEKLQMLFEQFIIRFSEILLILSDSKFLIINSNDISLEKGLLLSNAVLNDTILLEPLVKISNFFDLKKFLNPIINEEVSDLYKYIMDFYKTQDEDLKWITELGFSFSYNFGKIEYNKDIIPLKKAKLPNNIDNSTHLILGTFGIHYLDIDKFIILNTCSPYSLTRHGELIEKSVDPTKLEHIYVLIRNYKKCIQIGYKDNKVVKDECFLIDTFGKYQLKFNIDYFKYPFMIFVPNYCPFLCYENNNNYYLDFIHTSAFKNNLLNRNFSKTFKKKSSKEKNENFFKLITFKISPSFICPIINSFDIIKYNSIFELWNQNKINLITYFDFMKKPYSIIENYKSIYLTLNENIPKLITFLETFIIIDKTALGHFNQITDVEQYNRALLGFLEENRLCNFKNQLCKIGSASRECSEFREILIRLKGYIISDISKEIDKQLFFINNFDKWIILMIINLLINIINSIEKIDSCWDIQYHTNTLKDIYNFIDTIKTKTFFNFEFLFLIQNEYVYRKNQIERYLEIRKELQEKNPSLKLHQFMMGKGKTSMFTPLLAFTIKIICAKQPTIITANHLVKQTKQFLTLTEDLLSFQVNVFSDFEAKKRWIETSNHPPINRIDLGNEYNIIDEFDSHHNYLQSIFNYVKDEENISIEIFNYVFDYVMKKILNQESLIKSSGNKILDKNIDYFYEQSNKMKYKEKYGFSFIYFDDEKDNIWRICSPFTRKDTPIKNSNFSSIILQLILTFKTYMIEFEFKLQDNDYINIANNISIFKEFNGLIPEDLYKRFSTIKTNMKASDKIEIITGIITNFYESKSAYRRTKLEILRKYLLYVNQTKLKITKTQLNMSFQDIIYNNYEQWQVGYTGTTSMDLNKYQDTDKFVFREKISDCDEKVEIKLTLQYFSAPDSLTERNPVIIDPEIDWKANIQKIIDIIKNNPRGFVDLAGLFVDKNNKEVAIECKEILKDKNIIYIDKNDDKHKILDKTNIITFDNTPDINNFYYYDQCHTVGSDLKQPRDGHVAIIIDKNTRWTDFAQAIFRFRKMNRGTYATIICVKHDKFSSSPLTNKFIEELLIENEQKFNTNQLDGIKYQLLKTMVRKISHNYEESDLKPEYMRDVEFNKDNVKTYINNNICKIKDELTKHSFIKTIYDELIVKDELISLATGSGSAIETNTQIQSVLQIDEKIDNKVDILIIINKETCIEYFKKFRLEKINFIFHLNCEECIKTNCVKLFKSDKTYLINNKEIYISYNLLREFTSSTEDLMKYSDVWEDFYSNRFCFVEFNNFILIDEEYLNKMYYAKKLPTYDFNGQLLFPELANLNNEYPYQLNINPVFIKMLGIRNYISPKQDDEITEVSEHSIKTIVSDLNLTGQIILYYHILKCKTKRYNLSIELQNNMNELPSSGKDTSFIDEIKKPQDKKVVHNLKPKDDIENICYNINVIGPYNPLKLTETGYENVPPETEISWDYSSYWFPHFKKPFRQTIDYWFPTLKEPQRGGFSSVLKLKNLLWKKID